MRARVLLVALALGPAPALPQAHVLDGVEVSRVLLEARVLDGRGRAVTGLGPTDFRLSVDGRPVAIETAVWVGEGGPGSPRASRSPASGGPQPVPGEETDGRLIVLLFQKDLRRDRLDGLLRTVNLRDDLLARFGPRDRIAVLVFDTKLRLHLDFTSDRHELDAILHESVLSRWPDPPAAGPAPSLAAHLDPEAARRASSIEEALLALGHALQPIRGAKTLLLIGGGVGRLSLGEFQMHFAYDEARRALLRSRTTVFSLDFVEADYHSLEVGLQQVARDTGGLYFKTQPHLQGALTRLAEALSGHYVLSFERPPGSRGAHVVDLELARRRATVLTRSGYVD